jgi:hypothetical protein
MLLCPRCRTSNPDEATRCWRCGFSLTREPRLRGAGDFLNPGRAIMDQVHRRWARMGVRSAVLASMLAQVVIMGSLGWVAHPGILAGHAALAGGTALLLARLRWGALRSGVVNFVATLLYAGCTGTLHIGTFLGLWLLSFWYVLLGHALKGNEDLHGSGGPA